MSQIDDILQQARENDDFRRVIETGDEVQVVLMSIEPGSEIGEEVHDDEDQLVMLVEGQGKVVLDGEESDFNEGDMVLVPKGTSHNFITEGDDAMKIITTYSPPHHPDGTIHTDKEAADAAEEEEE